MTPRGPGGGAAPRGGPAPGHAAVQRAMAVVVFAVGVASFSRIPLLPDIGADLDLGTGELGLLTAAFGLGRLVTDIPAGRLAGSGDRRASLAAASAAIAAACALLAAAGSFAVALAASALIGAGSALANTIGMYVFATATEASRRGASMAVFATALMAGLTAGPAVGGVLASLAGWREVMLLSGLIALATAGACLAGPLAAALAAQRPRAGGPRAPARPGEHAGALELAVIAAVPFVAFFAFGGVVQTLVPIVGDEALGLSTSAIGLAVGIGGSTRFISAFLAGRASDRFSRRAVLVPALLCSALGSALLILPGTAAWLAAIAVLAFGSSAISVGAAALTDRVPQQALGRQLGVYRLTGDLGLLAGPLANVVAYQAAGRAGAAAVTSLAAAACAVAVAVVVRPAQLPASAAVVEDGCRRAA